MSFSKPKTAGLRRVGYLVVPLVLVAVAAAAQVPSRVARIAFISGSVSFRPASLDEWVAATVNYPMTTGDHLWTDPTGRAELQLGSVAVRVAPNTSVSFMALDDRTTQLRLGQGSVFVSVRDLLDDEVVEVDTPGGAVSLLARGAYRVDVNLTGDETNVTVRQGDAEVATEAATFSVPVAYTAAISGLRAPTHAIRAAVRPDEWEDWCQWRERRALSAARYVSPGMIGFEDLEEYGTWQAESEYGTVWVPDVHVGWAPYRFGHWAWIAPWGWTWIDDAWWGFAPFHYGRWAWVRARWVWIPGAWIGRPLYAPALVVFVGGPTWGVSVAVREPIGWFPLGPREPFLPPYRAELEYLRAINRPYVNITNRVDPGKVDWVNRLTPNGVTIVPLDVFTRGRHVGSAVPRLPADAVRRAPLMEAPASITPQRGSIVGEAVPRNAPRSGAPDRPVVARRPPPVAGGTSPRAPSASPPPQVRTVVPPPERRPSAAASPPPAPAPPPQSPAPPAPRRGDLATQQAVERARLEAQHDAEQAKTRAREAEEQRRAQDAQQRQRVDERQQQERQKQDDRQKSDHQKTDERQARERKPAEKKP